MGRGKILSPCLCTRMRATIAAKVQHFPVIHELPIRDFGYLRITSGTLHDYSIEREKKEKK